MKKIFLFLIIGFIFAVSVKESMAIGDGVVKQNGKIICVSAAGACTVTYKDGTTTELPGMQNAKAETSMIGNAPAMNTLSLTDYKIDENFFIFDGPNAGEGFGVIGGRMFTKVNGDCFVDPGYFYVLSSSSTYVTYAAWLAAVGNL